MSRGGARREGWGSAEATEMVLNNLFYITAKVPYIKCKSNYYIYNSITREIL